MGKQRRNREARETQNKPTEPLIQGFDKIPPNIQGVPLVPKVKKRKVRKSPEKLAEEQALRDSLGSSFPFWPGFPGLPESVREAMAEYWKQVPSDVIPNTWLYSYNPPGFGTTTGQRFVSPVISGQTLFDDPFYTTQTPPPLGEFDPTYPMWLRTTELAEKRAKACPVGKESAECTAAREEYYAACNAYARALDRVWGLNRVQDDQPKQTNGQRTQSVKDGDPPVS
ncbi:hypothetical protein [Tumebacillus flagellatus]|uniref:Uncharacterized protein n=1 Tax=Tumebacillus flagellatus TaxID=1157490 RepID=A0A074LKH0_9BACL|nr:hypothetical protein [Tumebacillus flagellatus]KEO81085.1 hypothetical protein EL26_22575 [Tumebacillus flagellatus]